MNRITMNIAVLATASACLTGCQQTGNWIAKRFGSSEPESKVVRNPPAPPAAPVEEMTPEKQARIQLAMARAYEKQGNAPRALELYEEAIKVAPKSAEAHHRLAVLHDQNGQLDKSHEHYRKALSLDPKNADIHSDYGYSCYLQGRMDDAERHLRQALAIDAQSPRAHNNLGILLARKGNVEQALTEFKLAGCTEGEARVNLAMAMMAEGKLDAANQQLAMASNLPSVSAETRAKVVNLQSLVARVDKREASPLPPSTMTVAPASAAATSVPSVPSSQSVDFVKPATFDGN